MVGYLTAEDLLAKALTLRAAGKTVEVMATILVGVERKRRPARPTGVWRTVGTACAWWAIRSAWGGLR